MFLTPIHSLMNINNLLSFDIWYRIAISNPESFAAVNSINQDIYNYTKRNIEKYKHKFIIMVHYDGKIKYGKLPNGDKHGLYQRWYKNGKLQQQRHYVNGKREGLYQEWYKSGKLFQQYNYINGKREGLYQSWYADGQLNEQWNYVNGDIQ